MKVIDIERVIILMRMFQYGWTEEDKKDLEKTLREILEMQGFEIEVRE